MVLSQWRVPWPGMNLDKLAAFCQESGFALAAEQQERFAEYVARLYEFNQVANVTRVPLEECEQRHLIDSLLVARFIPTGVHVLDIGSGPGLPAWPLACARPDLQVTALDSSGKMLRVPESCPLPNLTIVQVRAEDWGVRERFEAVTGRAVAPFPLQAEVSAGPLRKKGLFVPFRTPRERTEITSFPARRLGLRLVELVSVPLPGTEVVRLFPLFVKTWRTPPCYPRSWPEMKAKPLDCLPSQAGSGSAAG